MSANLVTTVHSWLNAMKIRVSKTYLRQQLLSHPDYPSLLSITDTLNGLGLENTAVKIEKAQVNEIDVPFLVHLNNSGGEFAMVKNKIQDQDFFKRWDGIVVAAEKPANWHNKENKEWLHKDLKNTKALLFTLSVFVFFTIASQVISFDWSQTALLLIAAGGIFVSWLIVSKALGIENKIAEQVCGTDADCDSIIRSNTVKLPFNISWSDAGIIYFSFLLTVLVLDSFSNSPGGKYPLLAIISVAALPFSFISIYYQWCVIKKWCRLCLVTVALLWLQFIFLLPVVLRLAKHGFNSSIGNNAAQVLFLLFAITAAWLWLKPLIKENKKLEAENFVAKRFSRNPVIFNAILEKQKKLKINSDGLGISIGNPAATNTIIKVCNPYCGPCAKAHSVIEKLLEENDNLKVQIIFTASDDEKDSNSKPVKHLMALNEKYDETLINKALDDWYLAEKKDYDAFACKYALNGELETQGKKLKAMKAWCDEVKIEFTPTFFVNGYQLPKQYTIEEVKYFLS